MSCDPSRHHRRSIRLRNYDYSQPGAYFVTIDVQGGECLFGEVVDEEMRLTDGGRVVEVVWAELGAHFPNVTPDAFVLMPNHVHGIVVIRDPGHDAVGAGSPRPGPAPREVFAGRPTLGQIVAYLKHETTIRINALRKTPYAPVWQRNYYEHVIRDQADYERACRYIAENPPRWAEDAGNPARDG